MNPDYRNQNRIPGNRYFFSGDNGGEFNEDVPTEDYYSPPSFRLPNISQMRIADEDTSSLTRQRCANLQAEIEQEQDSATVPRSPPYRNGSRTRDQIPVLKQKLELTRQRKNEIAKLADNLNQSQIVDLCFLIDCTASMQPYITQVKTRIDDIIAHCIALHPHFHLKVAFVGYRDHKDGDDRVIQFDFSDEIADFKSFVSKIIACGGNDDAEDVFGGLELAGKLRWSAPTRILFHVADAPCHGLQYHESNVSDEFPNGDPRGRDARVLLSTLEDLNVKYWFAKLSNTTDKMIINFKQYVKRSTTLEEVQLETAEQLMFVVADSVSTSIRNMEVHTMTVAALDEMSRDDNTMVEQAAVGTKRERSLKKFTITDNVPNWSILPVEKASVIKHELPKSVEELKEPLTEKCKIREIKIAKNPFAQGTQRIVYYGIDCSFQQNKNVVFKEFKFLGNGLNKLNSYKQQMEIQTISAFLAQQFNRAKPTKAKEVLFTKVVVVSLRDRCRPSYFCQEPLIEGDYVKYNSNQGFVNKDDYEASLSAFSHWTYHVTNKYLMVVDLQGVKNGSRVNASKFILTDPALHCKDVTRFCSTNLGNDGMHRFFRSHRCNEICRAMNCQPHRYQPTS